MTEPKVKRTRRSLWIPDPLWEEIRGAAALQRRTLSNFILVAVDSYLNANFHRPLSCDKEP